MIKIDELNGVELALAVAEACGFVESRWYDYAPSSILAAKTHRTRRFEIRGKCPCIWGDGFYDGCYRPDRDLARAWELLDGYIYAIDTYEFRAEQFGAPVGCYLRNDDGAWLAHGDTVEEAICRTYLKAKAREVLDD